jgi:hypothetical protein
MLRLFINHSSFVSKPITNQLNLIEGSLEVKLPTIWTDGKAEVGRVREEINDSTTKTYVFPTLNCGRKQ